MNIYIYIYIYIYIMNIYMYMYRYGYIRTYTSVCIFIHICTHIWGKKQQNESGIPDADVCDERSPKGIKHFHVASCFYRRFSAYPSISPPFQTFLTKSLSLFKVPHRYPIFSLSIIFCLNIRKYIKINFSFI